MAALVHRDVLPYWLADEAPGQALPTGDFQTGIFSERNGRVGTSWTTVTTVAGVTTVYSFAQLEVQRLSGLSQVAGPLQLETVLTLGEDGTLDDFKLVLTGGPVPIRVSAERFGSDFACTLRIGQSTMTVPFDGRTSSALGDSLRPFMNLGRLRVGQSWRMRLLDPLALVRGEPPEFKTELARVTRREIITLGGQQRDCLRIETQGAVAWADDDGHVLRQEVTIPFLGKWSLIDEPYDAAARKAAMTARPRPPRDASRPNRPRRTERLPN